MSIRPSNNGMKEPEGNGWLFFVIPLLVLGILLLITKKSPETYTDTLSIDTTVIVEAVENNDAVSDYLQNHIPIVTVGEESSYGNILNRDSVLIESLTGVDENFNDVLKIRLTNPFKKTIKSTLLLSYNRSTKRYDEFIVRKVIRPGSILTSKVPGTKNGSYLKTAMVYFTDDTDAAVDVGLFFDWKVKNKSAF